MTSAPFILLGLLPLFTDPPPERDADSTYFNISFQAQEALAVRLVRR